MAASVPQRTRAHNTDLDKEIIDAAQRLLHTQGDEGFTIQQLVDEAGVALQTFYRHFAGKDQLLLALLERSIAEFCAELREATQEIDDPVERMRVYVTRPLGLQRGGNSPDARAFTHEHFRLYQLYPDEVSRATGAFAALVLESLEAARAHGLAISPEPPRDAWMITELVMTTFHHYSFMELGPDADAVIAHLWQFCRAAIGATETA
jgi:TetR/AcrR family transcriptional regulator